MVVPAAIGVACAATGVGLIATVAIGAAAGATIAASTAAASTAQQDGKVDWETVGVSAGVGAVVGVVVSGASYGITKLVQGANAAKGTESTGKVAENTGKATESAGKTNEIVSNVGEEAAKVSDNVNLKDLDSHIFSKQHVQEGIMDLGKDKQEIFDKFVDTAKSVSEKWVEGSNEIRTTINGIDTTVRFFVKDGVMINIDGFVGFSGRVIGTLISLL